MEARTARELLEAERERLLRVRRGLEDERPDLTAEGDAAVELSPIDQHQADVGSEVFEREKDRSILGSVDSDLRDVADALDRLDRGVYGACLTCGAAIDDERLEAVPATRYCVTHEVLWEGTQMTWSVPAGVGADEGAFAESFAGREAARHLEFLPTDDEWAEELDLGPEERALHASDGDGTHVGALDVDQFERAEEREGDEGRAAQAWERADAEDVATEEEQLTGRRPRAPGRR